jgi:glucokinase
VAVTAGVDMGGTKIQTAIVRGGKPVGQARLATPQGGPAEVLTAVRDSIAGAAADARVKLEALAGIGVGFPGIYDEATGEVINAPNIPAFQTRYPLGRNLSEAFGGTSVTFDNDVRAAVRGEHRAGAGRPFKDLLGVFVGTGVGGGLILEGSLRMGQGAAGEIGHTVVRNRGRLCGCGRQGCLEAYAGRGRMEVRARALMERGENTILFKLMEQRGRDRLTSGVIASALDRGDKMAKKLIDDAVWALGVSLASAQNLLDLEAIIVGGGLGDRLGQPFIARVATAMKPHLLMDKRPPKMLGTELGDLSGAVGAGLLALDASRSYATRPRMPTNRRAPTPARRSQA